ncbi:hypothetical protein BD410DRAFT_785388 [Rickenella mellea]|uniref:TFG box profile domain-containing protein n=1 Tax=Rickenella mellea TaxID=50990 RepID=A0A4Y7QBE1_9AGAM|nr:hypothetical protein BD410DRAFT_785388 [Rickenella mellea]
MAMSFIGKPISLISHSDVRYRGILAGIDAANSTIQLQNVYSMGTENRRPPAEFIPPADQPYQYIIFRASEVKDLAVDPTDPPPQRNLHDDPAIIGASAAPPPMPNAAYGGYPGPQYSAAMSPQQQGTQASRQPQPVPQTLGSRPHPQGRAQEDAAGATANTNGPAAEPRNESRGSNGRRVNSRQGSVHTAAASLETVERALGDLRVSNANASAPGASRGGGRRGGGRAQEREIKVPQTDFDFASSNARFDKASLAANRADNGDGKGDDEKTNPSEDEKEGDKQAKESPKEKSTDKAYNPQKSFFDSLSSSSNTATPQERGRGGGGGPRRGGGGGNGHGRNRREEEREKNVATFGEPGGVGLMGPGAYVPGWGGYGRRGGGRGGRRGAAVANGGRPV